VARELGLGLARELGLGLARESVQELAQVRALALGRV
jgi:hypothetical protein